MLSTAINHTKRPLFNGRKMHEKDIAYIRNTFGTIVLRGGDEFVA